MEGRGVSRMAQTKAPRGKRKRPPDPASESWNKLPWRKLEQHVYRIQKRIFKAKQQGNAQAVHKLQKLLMKSRAARLLAVRRVTQDNQGKKTAGVDGVKSVTPAQRLDMVESHRAGRDPVNTQYPPGHETTRAILSEGRNRRPRGVCTYLTWYSTRRRDFTPAHEHSASRIRNLRRTRIDKKDWETVSKGQ